MPKDQKEQLTHFDHKGNAIMVDVSEKGITGRFAVAEGTIKVNEKVMEAILSGGAAKGDVLGVARIAGIMGTKKNSDLIPLCHIVPLSACTLDFETDRETLSIRAICTAKTDGKTGVEMEALTGVSIALLTIYDMCKAMDRGMVISNIRLLEKSGGRSGHYRASPGSITEGKI
ncbi:cyclic pyranopterin monophosphate synthase accessory protein [Spirochaetia bacterium]|nr:cyclic pyranopterin monophosphate synthase accessory protein [Spirochaetia bacterium]